MSEDDGWRVTKCCNKTIHKHEKHEKRVGWCSWCVNHPRIGMIGTSEAAAA